MTAGRTGPAGSPGKAAAAQAVDRAEDRLQELQACVDALRGATGAGSAADGQVEAEVDCHAAPAALRMRPGVRRLTGEALAAAVVEAFAEAERDLAARHGAALAALGAG